MVYLIFCCREVSWAIHNAWELLC